MELLYGLDEAILFKTAKDVALKAYPRAPILILQQQQS